jgi:hypothetical protein
VGIRGRIEACCRSILRESAMPLFEQPLFRAFDVCKYAKIYPTIPSHYFGEPFLVKMFWSACDCDLYIILPEDLSLAP